MGEILLTMSEENVEIVRRVWEAALREPPDWETGEKLIDPKHEAITLAARVEGSPEGPGVQGWRDFRTRMNEAGEWRLDIDEFRPAPHGRVVLLCRFQLRGHASGAEINADRGIVCEVRDGRLVRTEVFETQKQALEAAGVAE